MKPTLIFLSLLLWSSAVFAAPVAWVEGVQMPAWLERTGVRQPLSVGIELKNNDEIRTGASARAQLRLGDGSRVRLGENAQLKLDDLPEKLDLNKVFSASLDVLAGAFRFTTQAVLKLRGERDIKVKISNITAGLRGTDVWGKAAPDRDILCLIEGEVSVSRGAEAPFTMKDPLTFYVAPKNAAPEPIAPVPQAQLKQWSRETEIQKGQGAIRHEGKWKIDLLTVDNQVDALTAYDRFGQRGYAVRIQPVTRDGQQSYTLRITHLPSQAEAQALAAKLKGQLGAEQPVVAR